MDELDELGTNAYLVFQIGDDLFAAEVEKVVRIAELPTITSIPKAPPYLMGVINQRGVVIPLINTFYKFGAKDTATDLFPVIVLFKIRFGGEEVEIAASVTAVRDVLPAEEYPVSLAPELGIKYKPEYIKGMISFNDSMVLLLDIDRVFATEEIIRIIELIETI